MLAVDAVVIDEGDNDVSEGDGEVSARLVKRDCCENRGRKYKRRKGTKATATMEDTDKSMTSKTFVLTGMESPQRYRERARQSME